PRNSRSLHGHWRGGLHPEDACSLDQPFPGTTGNGDRTPALYQDHALPRGDGRDQVRSQPAPAISPCLKVKASHQLGKGLCCRSSGAVFVSQCAPVSARTAATCLLRNTRFAETSTP